MPTIGADAGCADRPLETRRLVLRTPVRADAAAITALVDHADVARLTANLAWPFTHDDAAAWLTGVALGVGGDAWAITARADGALLGCVGLDADAEGHMSIGYWLGRAHWGSGIMSEAVARVLRHAFEDLGLAEAHSNVHPANAASRRILENMGFRFAGRAIIDAPARGGEMEVELCTLSRAHWLATRAAPVVLVSAAALIDADDRVLLARRPAGKALAGLWEFPGGKVAADETPEAALIRELREELAIETATSCLAPIAFASHAYDDFHLVMPLFACRVWQGTPAPREGQELAWVRPVQMSDYAMPPADAPLVAQLCDLL